MQQPALTTCQSIQELLEGELFTRVRTVCTREWYIVLASHEFLHPTPPPLSRTTHTCRSFTLLIAHIQAEEALDRLLEEGGEELQSQILREGSKEERQQEYQQHAARLLEELDDAVLQATACADQLPCYL